MSHGLIKPAVSLATDPKTIGRQNLSTNPDLLTDSGFVDRFWLPIAIAVLVGWGSLSFVLFAAFGWLVLLAIAGVVAAGTASAVVLARTGDRDSVEMSVSNTSDQAQGRFHNAA